MRKLFVTVVISATTLLFVTPAFAQNQTYNTLQLNNPGWFDGFYCNTIVPTLNPNWTSGSQNKINCEFWLNTDGAAGAGDDWVEMGYHNGYAFGTDGHSLVLNQSYSGLFAGLSQGSYWELDALPTKGWAPGQSHTMGALLYNTGTSKYAAMRADNVEILDYTNVTVATAGTMDVGLEWNTDNGKTQTASVTSNSTITNLNAHNSTGWIKWNTQSASNWSSTNSNSYVTTSFDSGNNGQLFIY